MYKKKDEIRLYYLNCNNSLYILNIILCFKIITFTSKNLSYQINTPKSKSLRTPMILTALFSVNSI